MAHFIKNGNTVKISPDGAIDIVETLPTGTYVVKYNQYTGYYLEIIDNFKVAGKIYGNSIKHRDKVVNTYLDRNKNTGVMLVGEKGSGKTMLSKSISEYGVQINIPTVIVNESFTGDEFATFLGAIEQRCIIIFDEFEKTYTREKQEEILTILDGVFPSNKLFIFTCNNKYLVDEHMKNRPGRIYYMVEFKGVSREFILEYCDDNLKNMDNAEGVCALASLFDQFNFDTLKALVEEMNRYNETAQEAIELLNAKPEYENRQKYMIELFIPNSPNSVEKVESNDDDWYGNPVVCTKWNIGYSVPVFVDGDEDYEYRQAHFTQADLKHYQASKGEFTFTNNKGEKLILKKEEKENMFNYGHINSRFHFS